MQVKEIKIFGERNTGTNLLERALREATNLFIYPGNLPPHILRFHAYLYRFIPAPHSVQRFNEFHRDWLFAHRYGYSLGWKHARTPVLPPHNEVLPETVAFVTLRKNPYSWLLSLHRRPYAARQERRISSMSFSDFLRTPWPTAKRENARMIYESPVDIWSDKVAAYDGLSSLRPTHHMRYEDLIADPMTALEKIGVALKINVQPEKADFNRPTKQDKGSFDNYREYYLNEMWRSKISCEDIEFINSRLESDIVYRSGYKFINTNSIQKCPE